jgi:SAM-dependent methyltransferase
LSALSEKLRRAHHALPPPLKRVSAAAADRIRGARFTLPTTARDFRFKRARYAERLYGWWWWRSPNRPHVIDQTYVDVLDAIPAGSYGLDLGSRQRIRPDAVTLDVEQADGVDVVGDGHDLPWPDDTFDYVWCNAVLEHVRNPFVVASEIVRTLKPGGVAIVQVPFLENVHGWPDDYYRFTINGLRQLFADLDEVNVGTSAGPGQVLPDLVQYYSTAFSDLQGGGLLVNLVAIVVGAVLLPIRLLDRVLTRRPSYWKWARAYYYVGRKPEALGLSRPDTRAEFLLPATSGDFDEIMSLRAADMVEAIRKRGVTVRANPTPTGFGDFVTAPNLNYLLLAASEARRSSQRRVLLWDDPLGALALWLAQNRQGQLGHLNAREDGVLDTFRSLMHHPGDLHFAWDTGHIAAVSELGIVDADAVTWYEIATYPPFLEQGRAVVEPDVDVAFCGNLYEAALGRSNFADGGFYTSLTEQICERRLAHLDQPVWDIFKQETEALPSAERLERGLVPDASPFWDFYLYAVWLSATTRVRLSLLRAVDRPVTVYGMFADPESVALLQRHPNFKFAGAVHHYRELPRVFASAKVNVCIANGLIYQGVPSKLIDCLASGGFALTDPKDDLVTLFGSDVERIVFRSAEELNAKIEYYLERPAERREIVEHLRAVIEERCTLDSLFTRVIAAAAQ